MLKAHKKQLEQQLWNIADTLRGKTDADEFRDYILGFIFYKCLSDKMHRYADKLLEDDDINYFHYFDLRDIPSNQEYLSPIRKAALERLGYFLKPWELFSAVSAKGIREGGFILDALQQILNNIEQSTVGTASEQDFDKLFEDLASAPVSWARQPAIRMRLCQSLGAFG